MLAERLHHIVDRLVADESSIRYMKRLAAVKSAVQNRINEPGQPNHTAAISQNLKLLFESLDESATYKFPPTWRKDLVELDLDLLLAQSIRSQVEEIFRTTLVDNERLEQLIKLERALQNHLGTLAETQTGLKRLGIGVEELEPEECELCVVVPREYVNNDLRKFSDELKNMENIFKTFSELFGED